MISMFYTKKEMATRMAILYTGNMLASSFSGLIAAAVFQLDGRNGLAGWQWLFVWLGNTSELAELLLMFTDHSRCHLDRYWHRRYLHPSRQSTPDSLAHPRREGTSSPSYLRRCHQQALGSLQRMEGSA